MEPIPQLVDSHCHLDFPEFCDDIEEIVLRAQSSGVGKMLTICTRPSCVDKTRAIAERFPEVYFAAGVHPHWVEDEEPVGVSQILKIAEHPKMVGIGESGLDFHYTRQLRKTQIRSFKVHIRAARESGLPLIVHARSADKDMIEILREQFKLGGFNCVMHCFSSGPELAEAAVELGFYLSMSGIITFRNAKTLRSIFRSVPVNRVLIETDAPYLSPVPFRGKRNEPSFVVETANVAAGLYGLGLEEFAQISTDNFNRLFKKSQSAS